MECSIYCPTCQSQSWDSRRLRICSQCGLKCPFCLSVSPIIGNCAKCKLRSRDTFYCNKCYTCPQCHTDLQPSVKTLKDPLGKTLGKKVKFKCHNCTFKFNTDVLTTPKPLGEFVWDSVQTNEDLRFRELANAIENRIEGKSPLNDVVIPIDSYEMREDLKPAPKKLPISFNNQCLNCLEDTIEADLKIPVVVVTVNGLDFINDTDFDMTIQIGQIDNWEIPLEAISIPSKTRKLIPISSDKKSSAGTDLDVVINTINNGVRYKMI